MEKMKVVMIINVHWPTVNRLASALDKPPAVSKIWGWKNPITDATRFQVRYMPARNAMVTMLTRLVNKLANENAEPTEGFSCSRSCAAFHSADSSSWRCKSHATSATRNNEANTIRELYTL